MPKQTLRVLYLCSFLDGESSARYGYGWAQAGLNKKRGILSALKAADIDVIVVSPMLLTGWRPRYHRGREQIDPSSGARVIFPATVRCLVPVNIFVSAFSTWCLIVRIRREWPFDAILFYNWHIQFVIPGLLSKWWFGSRLILQYEDGLFAGAKHRSVAWLARFLEAVFDRCLDAAIINSWNFRNRTAAKRVVVVRGTVSTLCEPEGSRAPGGPLVVMFSGKLDEIRGIDLFLDVCRGLAGRQDIHLWITGDGAESVVARVEETVAELEADNVRFFGFLPYEEYKRRLGRTDVLVSLQKPDHPFSQYCFPSKLIEFMAMGKTIVATEVSDVHRIAEGRLVLTPPDPAEIMARLIAISRRPEEYATYGDAARRWVQETCNADRQGQLIRELLIDDHERDDKGELAPSMVDPGAS